MLNPSDIETIPFDQLWYWARAVDPGVIKTVPFDQLWYNAPFDEFLKVRIRLTNGGDRRLVFHLKSTVSADRIEIDPANGCLDPNKVTNLWVTVKPFSSTDTSSDTSTDSSDSGADTSSDRVTIEWTDLPPCAAKVYCPEWFEGDCVVRSKNMALKYNE